MASIPLRRPEVPETEREAIPPLENGDHLDQKTFHERYEAMPPGTRAELIGGIVYMASPLKRRHGRNHIRIGHWVSEYSIHTPGTEAYDNTTTILDEDAEPQPDVFLMIEAERGGQSHWNEDDFLEGAPELIAEIASSRESIALHKQKDDYESAGVREYIVVAVRQRHVYWFVLRDKGYEDLKPGEDGIFRSEVFPGLWLDPASLLDGNMLRVLEVLRQGLATPEHAAFVAKLAAAAPDSTTPGT